MPDLSHQTIKGYHLSEKLGTGGFGAVYKAAQPAVGRDVAIKIILPGLANQPDFIRRFETEAQVIARLEHPCIVPLYDYWRDPDGAYLVMRWLRGGSLSDLLKRGALEIETVSHMLDQLAAALTLAHRSSIVHRDIKPGNILMDEDGNAYLADFGIAKDLQQPDGSGTQMDAIVGSLDYISPEQARSEPVTPRTDIYSLGVVLYEMLTGEHPFPDTTSIERLYKHINDPLPDMTGLDEGIRDSVNAVVQKATAKNPLHRYESVSEFAAQFKDAAGLNRVTSGDTVVELLRQREHEVLSLLVAGLSNKEIAAKLVVTIPTVKWYINEIFRKLRVRTRVQAIIRARELNLIVPAGTIVDSTEPSIVRDALPEPVNPYKGLRAFEAADERDFFGREDLVQKLLKRLTPLSSLTKSEDEARFLAVVGPSGSGKSSVVKAGLIPALLRGGVPGSERWFVIEMMPGSRPFDELEVALGRIMPGQVAIHDTLTRDEHGLLRAAGLILPQDGSELVIVIDQFEEVFTLVEDEGVRVNFLKLLLATATEKRSRVRLVLTLRADFYDRPLNYPEFGDLLKNHMETILPLSAKGIERAITEPAKHAGVKFEEGLIATIVSDVNYQAGALPLLQYALTELFEQRDERLITYAAYQGIGGAAGALARRAEAIYLELSSEAQGMTRQMFLRLVTPGEGVEDTRRRTARAELAAISPDSDVLDEVIDIYATYRLLALDHDPASRLPTVEVAHEALLREWERLRGWLNENRNDIRQERAIAGAAGDWQTHHRDMSYLPDGSRLAAMVTWHNETKLAPTPLERDFINASIAQHDARQATDEARKAREKRMEQRSRTFLRGLVAVLLLAMVGAFGLTGAALSERNRAESALATSESNTRVIEQNALEIQELALLNGADAAFASGDNDLARVLSFNAYQLTGSAAAETRLAESAYAPGVVRRLSDPAFTGDFWASVAFSPDAQKALSGSLYQGTVTYWDLKTGHQIRQFTPRRPCMVVSLALNPQDASTALIYYADETLLLWDVEKDEMIRTLYEPPADVNCPEVVDAPVFIQAIFSPDGRRIINGRLDGRIEIRATSSGEILFTLQAHQARVESVSLSPDGTVLLSGDASGLILKWDMKSGQVLDRLQTTPDTLFTSRDIAFSPDGHKFAIANPDNFEVTIRDVNTMQIINEYRSAGPTENLSFTPDSNFLVMDVWPGGIVKLDPILGTVTKLAGPKTGVFDIALSPDGRYVLSSFDDDRVYLWDLQNGAVDREYTAAAGWENSNGMAKDVSGDGTLLALSVRDSTRVTRLLLYDTTTGQELRRFGENGVADDSGGLITMTHFSPDGHSLVSIGETGNLKLWDTLTGKLRYEIQGEPGFLDSNFTPDSRELLLYTLEIFYGVMWQRDRNYATPRFKRR